VVECVHINNYIPEFQEMFKSLQECSEGVWRCPEFPAAFGHAGSSLTPPATTNVFMTLFRNDQAPLQILRKYSLQYS